MEKPKKTMNVFSCKCCGKEWETESSVVEDNEFCPTCDQKAGKFVVHCEHGMPKKK